MEDIIPKFCINCNTKLKKFWTSKGKGPSPTLHAKCKKCFWKFQVETSTTWSGSSYVNFTNLLLMVGIVLTGSTWEKTSSLFNLLEIPMGSSSYYHEEVLKMVDKAVEVITKDFIADCRKKVVDRNDIFLMIDAEWRYPGWWARECTVIGIDCATGLPISVFHVIRGKNYTGSSKGNYLQ